MSAEDPRDLLDRRARAAAADLRGTAEARPVPTFDPELVPSSVDDHGLAGPRRTLRGVLAAAAVVAVVAGGAAWVTGRDDGADPPANQVRVDEIRPYLFEPEPEGFRLAGVAETDGSVDSSFGTDLDGGPLTTYGPTDDDPRVGVTVMATDPFGDVTPENTQEVRVGGLPAVVHRSPVLGSTAGLAVKLGTDPEGETLVVLGRDVDDDTMVSIAEATLVDGRTTTVDPASLPDGWRQLAVEDGGLMASSPMAASRGGLAVRSRIAMYLAEAADSASMLTVAAVEASEGAAFTQRLLLSDSETTTVRGHPAVVGRMGGSESGGSSVGWVVLWVERPGEALSVSGTGVDRESVLAAAETVVPADEARWDELLTSTRLGDLLGWKDGSATEVGRGTFADGTAWVLRTSGSGPDASLDLTVSLTGNSSASSETGSGISDSGSSGGGAEPTFGSVSTLEQSGRRFAAGDVTEAASRVELIDSAGATVGEAQLVSGAGVHAWVAELTTEAGDRTTQPVAVVAYDATGAELGRREVPWVNEDGSTHYQGDPVESGPTTTAGG